MAAPPGLVAHVPPIMRHGLLKAGGAYLARLRRVDLFDADSQAVGFVRDELGELEEGPPVLHAGVFAGLCRFASGNPTACACPAPRGSLADCTKGPQSNKSP